MVKKCCVSGCRSESYGGCAISFHSLEIPALPDSAPRLLQEMDRREWEAWSMFDEAQEPFNYRNQPGPRPGPSFRRNNQYRNAYPDYEGGYGGDGRRDYNFPDMFTRRGHVPNGAPFMRRNGIQEHAAQLLLRCGVTKNVVRSLPASFLVLIEPEYCGLCGMHFDNFSVATLHYTSKNHMKKQQKWLAEFNDAGPFSSPNSQAPMKARELYCELCDVQITSSSHAESHYSGKPHRAIVLGRKAPKNPFLNQFGMEKRLQQLIRREKRKLAEEDETEEPVAAKKSNVLVTHELYCGICKVTVTNVEQMTNHMNGKKHLSKEKQHILNTMKGGVDNSQQQSENDADADGADEDSQQQSDNDAEGGGADADSQQQSENAVEGAHEGDQAYEPDFTED